MSNKKNFCMKHGIDFYVCLNRCIGNKIVLIKGNMKTFVNKIYAILLLILKIISKGKINEPTLKQFIKHYLVGAFGVFLNYSLFNILVFEGLSVKISNTITHAILIVTIFILQRQFTYRVKHFSIWHPILFLLISLVYYICDTLFLILLVDLVSIHPTVSKIITIVILTPLSFLGQKYIVFRDFGSNDAGQNKSKSNCT